MARLGRTKSVWGKARRKPEGSRGKHTRYEVGQTVLGVGGHQVLCTWLRCVRVCIGVKDRRVDAAHWCITQWACANRASQAVAGSQKAAGFWPAVCVCVCV